MFCAASSAYQRSCFQRIWDRLKSIRWYGIQFGVQWTITRTRPGMELVHFYQFENVSRLTIHIIFPFIQNPVSHSTAPINIAYSESHNVTFKDGYFFTNGIAIELAMFWLIL